jgi:hypothetical protein
MAIGVFSRGEEAMGANGMLAMAWATNQEKANNATCGGVQGTGSTSARVEGSFCVLRQRVMAAQMQMQARRRYPEGVAEVRVRSS